jgi:hypothetical protein
LNLRAILAAWIGPAALAGLVASLWLLARNADGGMTWEAPLLLLGAPIALLAGCAAALGALLAAASRWIAGLRRAEAHAAASAFLAAVWLANAAGRSLSLAGEARLPLALLIGGVAGGAAWRVVRAPFGRALGRTLAAVACLATAAFALGSGSVAVRSRQGRADPRDAVPRFPPLPIPPERLRVSARVFVLGLDGATWDRIDPLMAEGRLPNFARLKREGACGRLQTLTPTLSAAIWTSVVTGKTPEVHGIRRHYVHRTSFLRRPNLRMETWMAPIRDVFAGLGLLRIHPVTSNLRRCKALWNIASESGLSVAVLGWWASQPPEPVNGWIVSEFASAARTGELSDRGVLRNYEVAASTHPPGLLASLAPLERTPESLTRADLEAFLPVDEEVWAELRTGERFDWGRPLTVFRATYLKDEFFAEAALAIEREHRPDLLLSYLKGIDVFGHFFWRYSTKEALAEGEDPKLVARYRGCVDRAYEWTDRILGRYLGRLGQGDTLIVLSDHGWERLGPRLYAHHRAPDGILAILGAHARAGAWLEGARVLDVAPTLLHLLGLPAGEDMTGRVLVDWLEGTPEPRSIPTWETTRLGSEEALGLPGAEEREHELRALGYVK